MRFEVTNLGRIRHAVMDLAPFTVFVGENGTNKTWAAYALYGLLDSGLALTQLDAETGRFVASLVDETLGDEPPTEGTVSVNFFRRDLLDKLQKSKASISLGHDELCLVLGGDIRLGEESAARLEVDLHNLPGALTSGHLSWHGPSIRTDFEPAPNSYSTARLAPSRTRREALARLLVQLLVRGKGDTVVFPTERVAINAGNILLGAMQRADDFVLTAYKTFLLSASQDAGFADADWSDAAKSFSQSVLGGAVTVVQEQQRLLRFFPTGQSRALSIRTSASVVKSLAGLALYLDSKGSLAGDTLIIDEPEMNAHPAAQLAIVECLASLVKRGVRIVITTHSPFVLDHLGTLVEASQVEGAARERIVEKLKLKSADAILQPSDLAVYRFDTSGEVRAIYDAESRVIDGSVFSDVGDAEANLFSDVLAAERRP